MKKMIILQPQQHGCQKTNTTMNKLHTYSKFFEKCQFESAVNEAQHDQNVWLIYWNSICINLLNGAIIFFFKLFVVVSPILVFSFNFRWCAFDFCGIFSQHAKTNSQIIINQFFVIHYNDYCENDCLYCIFSWIVFPKFSCTKRWFFFSFIHSCARQYFFLACCNVGKL